MSFDDRTNEFPGRRQPIIDHSAARQERHDHHRRQWHCHADGFGGLVAQCARAWCDGLWHIRDDPGLYNRLGAHLFIRYMAASRSEEHTSELQSLMRISYAVFCLKKKHKKKKHTMIDLISNTRQHTLVYRTD